MPLINYLSKILLHILHHNVVSDLYCYPLIIMMTISLSVKYYIQRAFMRGIHAYVRVYFFDSSCPERCIYTHTKGGKRMIFQRLETGSARRMHETTSSRGMSSCPRFFFFSPLNASPAKVGTTSSRVNVGEPIEEDLSPSSGF